MHHNIISGKVVVLGVLKILEVHNGSNQKWTDWVCTRHKDVYWKAAYKEISIGNMRDLEDRRRIQTTLLYLMMFVSSAQGWIIFPADLFSEKDNNNPFSIFSFIIQNICLLAISYLNCSDMRNACHSHCFPLTWVQFTLSSFQQNTLY